MSKFIDELGVIDDYSNMPKFELQQRAIFGDAKAERVYAERYGNGNKSAEIEKGNPNRDDKGRFTFGSGGEAGGGAGGAGTTETSEGGAGEATDYRGYHTAPRRADGFGAPATDVEEMMPDFYERPNIYTTGMPQADKESVSALMAIRGKPDKSVTIYRAVPENANTINPGDWVTMSPTYAKQHLLSNLEAGHVISKTIPAGDLWFDGDSINEFGYDPVPKGKSADIYKNNPNRDPKGRFTFGSGGPQGGGGAGNGESGESAGGGSGGSGDGVGEGKDITSELGTEYGTTSETKRAQELRNESIAPETRGDPILNDIAKKQGFDGEAEMLDQEAFDKVVAEGGTVTYRGITDHYDGPGPDAAYIEGETQITEKFAQGPYFAGNGVYGSGSYTTTERDTANYYATEDGSSGSVVTMAVRPNARIATPQQWYDAKMAAKEGKGGFMGADNEGRILAAQGFDGYRVVSPRADHPASRFLVVLNRKALVVLKK
jgi:hypothetical protein